MSNIFAIVGHARSGSSSLQRLLELHRDITIEAEPFNPERHTWEYTFDYKSIIEQDGFAECVQYLFQKYNGIKHLYEQLDHGDNQHLIHYVDKVIFLYRRNRLQAAVSLALSHQTQHWGEGKHPKNHIWQPLDPDIIQHTLYQFGKFQRHLGRYSDTDHIILEHDELYGDGPIEAKLARMNEIFQFLGRKPLTHPRLLRECAGVLDRSNKTSGFEVYRQIPNIMEIEQRFGNDINGRLF